MITLTPGGKISPLKPGERCLGSFRGDGVGRGFIFVWFAYWIPLCFMCWRFVERRPLPQPLMVKFNSNDFEMQLLFCLTTMTWVKGCSPPRAAGRPAGALLWRAGTSPATAPRPGGGAGGLGTGRFLVRSPARHLTLTLVPMRWLSPRMAVVPHGRRPAWPSPRMAVSAVGV